MFFFKRFKFEIGKYYAPYYKSVLKIFSGDYGKFNDESRIKF